MSQSSANTGSVSSHCQVNMHLRPKLSIGDTLNSFDLNRIILEIDQTTHILKWGKASFEVLPGHHRIVIWLKNPLVNSPKVTAEIVLQEGEVANVEFTGPTTVFAPGRIDYKVESAPVSQSRPIDYQAQVCLGCGKRLPEGESRFCPFCGAQTPTKLICQKCGASQSGGKFCGFCGTSLE